MTICFITAGAPSQRTERIARHEFSHSWDARQRLRACRRSEMSAWIPKNSWSLVTIMGSNTMPPRDPNDDDDEDEEDEEDEDRDEEPAVVREPDE